jgi:DNA-binding XRE family transcriptional regulator
MPTPATSSQSRKRTNTTLVALRINAGLSREDLAARIQVGRETIRLAEAGFVPTPRIQFLIAAAFELSPLDIWPIERQKMPTRPKRKLAA